MKTDEKALSIIKTIFEWFASLSLALMTILISLQVLFRYVLSSPLAWTEELARFTFIWMTFVASILASVSGEHVAITMLQERLKGIPHYILVATANIFSAAFFGIVTYYTTTQWSKLGTQTSAALKIPMNMVYLGIIIGCLFMTLWYVSKAIRAVINMFRKKNKT